jgi:hypothetical protein
MFSSLVPTPLRSKSHAIGTRHVLNRRIPYSHPRSLLLYRESFPAAQYDQLVSFLLNITGRSIALGLSKVILRKLFVAVRLGMHRRFPFFSSGIIH